jgi:hypothetical protein
MKAPGKAVDDVMILGEQMPGGKAGGKASGKASGTLSADRC